MMRHLLQTPLPELLRQAAALRDAGHGDRITYSRKVFIPLTQLCRDSCHYCTFAQPPRPGRAAYMPIDQVLAIAHAGAAAGCKEALFTLGDKPELRYAAARTELDALGHATTLSYLAEAARRVLAEAGLLPHINAGVMDQLAIEALRAVSVSQGIMLETASDRLSARGQPHHGSPDKTPALRLDTIEAAGRAAVPFTSGLLIGIGESRQERLEALLALHALHTRHGHIQEIIIQNFRAKPGTRMHAAPEPPLEEQLWTIAAARLIFGAAMNIQSPPNLRGNDLAALLGAGLNDWGGVSPVTPDHVNPEAPWPEIEALTAQTAQAGKHLAERLAVYPAYALEPDRWLAPALRRPALRLQDAAGLARPDAWIAGAGTPPPRPLAAPSAIAAYRDLSRSIDLAMQGRPLQEHELVGLFEARGPAMAAVCAAADLARQEANGDDVSYVVTRNINYTNVCHYRCQFCAFSKGNMSENLRGRPYDLDIEEIQRRAIEAWDRGGTELCLQGGIHPAYTGHTYLAICRAIKAVTPTMHIHAFSPLEVFQGAVTIGWPVEVFLTALKEAGLGSLPGTAAEVLDDEVRAIICPDKVSTAQWLHVVGAAHRAGLRTTSTIMFGHVDRPVHWARHLLRLRRLQDDTGGITEFVPLPFVPMETPIFLKGRSRAGPTYDEAILMHAVGRLALHGSIPNIQASWVKMGPHGAAACLQAGVNDLGGTLMEETITKSAGAVHGQEMTPRAFIALIEAAGRRPRPRNTIYGAAAPERVAAALAAPPLLPSVQTPVRVRHSAHAAE